MKNLKKILYSLITLSLVAFVLISCTKEEEDNKLTEATITTSDVSEITESTAICGGKVTANGGSAIISKGICWNTSQNPTIENNKIIYNNSLDEFICNMEGLTSGINYYVRAFVTNGVGTSYGNEQTFATKSGTIVLTTYEYFGLTTTSVYITGMITEDGGVSITERGVCYSETNSPTLSNYIAIGNGIGKRSYTSTITNLTPNTTYYARAYAKNNVGISYGNELYFKTLDNTVVDVDGNVYKTIQIGNQIWMAENLRTTKYRNGDIIPNLNSATDWGSASSGATCYYENNTDNLNIYGRLYNWNAVNDSRNIAPQGWHVASGVDWGTMENYLVANGYYSSYPTTGNKIAKALASNSYWDIANYAGVDAIGCDLLKNNKSGFSALPGGYRDNGGNFWFIGTYCYMWTSTAFDSNFAWYRFMENTSGDINRNYYSKKDGFSVRCVKD